MGKELNLQPNPATRFISVLVRHICRVCVSWYPVYLMAEQIIDTDITVMAAAPAPGPGTGPLTGAAPFLIWHGHS